MCIKLQLQCRHIFAQEVPTKKRVKYGRAKGKIKKVDAEMLSPYWINSLELVNDKDISKVALTKYETYLNAKRHKKTMGINRVTDAFRYLPNEDGNLSLTKVVSIDGKYVGNIVPRQSSDAISVAQFEEQSDICFRSLAIKLLLLHGEVLPQSKIQFREMCNDKHTKRIRTYESSLLRLPAAKQAKKKVPLYENYLTYSAKWHISIVPKGLMTDAKFSKYAVTRIRVTGVDKHGNVIILKEDMYILEAIVKKLLSDEAAKNAADVASALHS